ncbi:MAG: T9SS type A sorting domain-containing protein [Sphingobacteriia bacterium]|nr:T9SS type A sorting domain-containing protein [Sphingobacteriia bacterium]
MKGREELSGYETIITEKEEIHVDLCSNTANYRVIVCLPENENKVHYQISDPEGRLIARDSFTYSDLLIDLSNYKTGIYIIRLEIDGEMVPRRIVMIQITLNLLVFGNLSDFLLAEFQIRTIS